MAFKKQVDSFQEIRRNSPIVGYPAAAAFLGVSERKLCDLVGKNTIPHFRLGSSVRFDLDQLREWVAAEVRKQQEKPKGTASEGGEK